MIRTWCSVTVSTRISKFLLAWFACSFGFSYSRCQFFTFTDQVDNTKARSHSWLAASLWLTLVHQQLLQKHSELPWVTYLSNAPKALSLMMPKRRKLVPYLISSHLSLGAIRHLLIDNCKKKSIKIVRPWWTRMRYKWSEDKWIRNAKNIINVTFNSKKSSIRTLMRAKNKHERRKIKNKTTVSKTVKHSTQVLNAIMMRTFSYKFHALFLATN